MNKISLSEICYYIFFVLLLMAKGAGLYDGQPVFKILLVTAMVFWMIKMALTAYTQRELITVLLLLMLGGIVYLVSGEKGALLYIMMITGLKNVPVKRVFLVGCVSWGIVFVTMAWIHAIGLLEGPFKVHDKFGLGMVIRWGLGYSHPNVLHVSYLVMVVFLVYILNEQFCWKWALCLMAGNMLIFLYSLSSTGVIVVTFYLMLSLYWKYRGRLSKVEKVLIQLALPACVLFSLAAPFWLQGKWFDIVNNIVNTRLSLAKYFLSLKPPTLFGVRHSEIVTSLLTMDNSYVFAFVTYGIVLFVIIVLGYVILVHQYCKEQKGGELCLILACFVGGVTEPFLFNTSFKNISLLFMKDIIFEENKAADMHLLEHFEKEFVFSGERVSVFAKALRDVWKKKNTILLAAVIGFVIGSIGYQNFKKDPVQIIVPRSECEINNLEDAAVYLSLADIAALGESKVLGYVDNQTEMLVYSGNIVRLEHLRGIISCGMTGGALLVMAVYIINVFYRKLLGLLKCRND